jgi:hypothetical protein
MKKALITLLVAAGMTSPSLAAKKQDNGPSTFDNRGQCQSTLNQARNTVRKALPTSPALTNAVTRAVCTLAVNLTDEQKDLLGLDDVRNLDDLFAIALELDGLTASQREELARLLEGL